MTEKEGRTGCTCGGEIVMSNYCVYEKNDGGKSLLRFNEAFLLELTCELQGS